VFPKSWWATRPALVAAGLALLGGTPAILTAAKVTNPLALGGADGAAAVTFVFGAAWQERYRRRVQHRDDQEFRLQDGCLVLADGRLPFVCEITNPVLLGVHQAAAVPTAVVPESAAGVPAYVPRDIDGQVREWLAAGGFVLLVGDSTAGKSRAAFEAVSTLPGHVLICPGSREALGVAVDRAAAERRCVLWLDDLERYLGADGLTPEHLGRLLAGSGHHRVVVATIRAAEQARITAGPAGRDTGRQTARDIRLVIGQARSIRVARMFTDAELERASARGWDPRIADALAHASSYGIAEYLAAGPELLRDWEDARASSEGPHARGAALVAAAIDIRRAGYISPLPRSLLNRVHEQYLADAEYARTPREPAPDAWAWATRPRAATTAFALLLHARGRLEEAEAEIRAVLGARTRVLGLDHPDTLVSHGILATILRERGRPVEAEAEMRPAMDAMTQMLGPDHPFTFINQGHFALILRDQGRLAEAEAEIRAVVDTRNRVLGPGHPDTLALATVLDDLTRKECPREGPVPATTP